MISYQRLKALVKKEFKHLLRDIRMLLILLLFPAFLLIIFGYAVNFDVENIQIVITDRDNSELTRKIIQQIENSRYFHFKGVVHDEKNIKEILDGKIAQCVIVFHEDFSKNFYAGERAVIQVLIDGVDGNTASIIQNYLGAFSAEFGNKLTLELMSLKGVKHYRPLDVNTRFWYNPELKTTRFLIPGLIGMILVITAVVSVALTLVREKERGTMEQINVSPINPFELLVGKSLPYLLLALFNAGIILVTGYFIFDVQVRGSLVLLFITTLVFLSAAIALGILISAASDSQQVAFMVSTMVSLLPSVILSGFIFPIESMPAVLQIITNITPVKFYIVILRAIILRGVGLEAFWDQVIYLLLFATVLLIIASVVLIRREKNS